MYKPIISLLIIVLSTGFAIFYVKPEYDNMNRQRDDLEKLRVTSVTANGIEDLIIETQKTLESVDSDEKARFEAFLPGGSDPIRFANFLQHIGFKNGLVFEGIKVSVAGASTEKTADLEKKKSGLQAVDGALNIFNPGRAASSIGGNTNEKTGGSNEKYVTTTANFAFTATAESFALLLNDFEKSLRLINVKSLSFTPGEVSSKEEKSKKAGPPIYKYTITIEAYSLK